jgi:Mg-chelatase subunit ChlD
MSPQASSQGDADLMLTDDPTEYPQTFYAKEGQRLQWVVGFQDDRDALLDRLEWQDPATSDPAIRMRSVDIEISTTSPIGPWTPIGTWKLDRADDGTVAPFVLPEGTWARFIRFTGSPVRKGGYSREVPAVLRVVEHATDDSYRSILAEWGQSSPNGPRELLDPPDLTPVVDADQPDDTPEQARPLAASTVARDRVHRGEDVDWYTITVPDGQNSVTFTVAGDPSVGVALTMVDAAGQPVAMTFGPGAVPGTVAYQANVTAGATYRVRVEQPPFSAVFTFDTSGSMGAYLAFVMQAMRTYTGGVVRGEEQALIIPFEEDPLLKEWSDDPYQLQDAVNRYSTYGGSSGAEAALLAATRALAGREGARAVLEVTDAETSSYQNNQELWELLDTVRPMVFSVHVGADSEPRVSKHFMQDWAMAGDGFYQYALSHGEMDRAFDRMAAWLRRPAVYSLSYATSEVEVPPPPPGTLSVAAPQDADGTTSAVVGKGVAVELILDTSGSMLEAFGGQRRIDIARRVLAGLVRDDIPPGVNVALRTFVRKDRSCDTELSVPLGPLDPEAMASRIEGIRILASVNTPLAKAIRAVATDLQDVTGPRIVIVVSDGQENCGGDPGKEVKRLVGKGFDITLNVVGLALDDSKVRKQIRRLAQLGHGTYFDARDPAQVAQAVRTAVSAPFQVFDPSGELVARGTVGGGPVKLPPGTYRVVVLSEPQAVYEGVVIETGGSVTVTLPSAGERPVEPEQPQGSPAPGASSTP